MHRMTRALPEAEVAAPFDGRVFRFKDDVATLQSAAGRRFVRLSGPGAGERLYRVTKVIGGRTREDFAGVRVATTADGAVTGEEMVLPVSWLKTNKTLRYKGYSVLVHERDHLEAGPPYSQTCILCHNMAPYLVSLYGALSGKRAQAFQGEVVDRLVPAPSRWSYETTDPGAMVRAVEREVATLGAFEPASPGAPLAAAIATTRARFDATHTVELGIGCESCHGGSREHAAHPKVRPSYVPRAPWLRAGPVDGHPPTRPEAINHACARCHQVLFSRYQWTWEGGSRSALAGGSTINSGEARDFLLGGCSKAMACTACHDPHAGGLVAAFGSDPRSSNALCTTCHASLASRAAARAHAHHDPSGAAGSCVACHMPRKNMGLSGGLTRYHRIGSPTDPLRVLGDRPLECALCHADKTVGQLVETMEAWWNRSYDRAILAKLYGNLSAQPLEATLALGKPHEQAVAVVVLGEKQVRSAVPAMALVLASERPLVRQYARDALVRVLGGSCAIDLSEPLAGIERAADACLTGAGLAPPVWPQGGARESTAEPAED
jgi:predicted CXXCH cytochrome family protein